MFCNLLSASWNNKVSTLHTLSAPWKREAVSSGYSICTQLQLQYTPIRRLESSTTCRKLRESVPSKSWTEAMRKTGKKLSTLGKAVKLMSSLAKDSSSVDREHLQSLMFEFGGSSDILRRWRPWLHRCCKTLD